MPKDILEQILISDDVVESINDNIETLFSLIPELQPMVDFPHNHPHHHLDVWQHNLLALSMAPNDFEVRLSLLLHDIGKPFCYQDEEVRHFRGHPQKSAEMSESILERLGFRKEESNRYLYIIGNHDTKISNLETPSDNQTLEKLFQVQCCDSLAHHSDKLAKRKKYLLETYEYLYKGENKESFIDWMNKQTSHPKVLKRGK